VIGALYFLLIDAFHTRGFPPTTSQVCICMNDHSLSTIADGR
jgi:hypothetical protein